jgi:hypothetical protein
MLRRQFIAASLSVIPGVFLFKKSPLEMRVHGLPVIRLGRPLERGYQDDILNLDFIFKGVSWVQCPEVTTGSKKGRSYYYREALAWLPESYVRMDDFFFYGKVSVVQFKDSDGMDRNSYICVLPESYRIANVV